MSEVRLVVRDAQREIHATRHGSFADAAVAALSAEPETIEELDTALERFQRPGEWSFFRGFYPGANDEPYDAGLVIIDLAARLIVCDSTYSAAATVGSVAYHDGKSATNVQVRYRLTDDWHITSDAASWRALAERRRSEREANPPLDARAVLYGRTLLEFVAAECLAAVAGEPALAGQELQDRDCEIVRDIHARWLLMPRDDLRGQAPRDVLLAKRDFIDRDLQYRCDQWSELGECPRGLDPDSHAFRYAGFGTHELVKYYDLVRDLAWDCWALLVEEPAARTRNVFRTSEIERLERRRDAWLDAPDPECHGLTPRRIIDHERARLPEGTSGREAVIDHDCPMCEMMAEMPGPVFWHLDGCNMDDEFAFSFHRTRAEWDEEQREYEEFSRQCDERRKERERLGISDSGPWQRSFAAEDDEGMSLTMRLYGIGSLLAELIVDLKEPTEDRPSIDRLHRDFGNLREVAQSSNVSLAETLLAPVLDRFGETLDAIAAARPDLQPKCVDLDQRLRRFLEPPSAAGPSIERADDDLPF